MNIQSWFHGNIHISWPISEDCEALNSVGQKSDISDVLFQSQPIRDCIDIIDNKHTDAELKNRFCNCKEVPFSTISTIKTYLKWTYDLRKYKIWGMGKKSNGCYVVQHYNPIQQPYIDY